MSDADSLARAVEGVDAVVHLVAIITGKPEEFEQVMTRGTESLVSAAERAGVRRFVLMSALGTSEATRELTPYYRAKWAMEQAVQAAPFEHTIFRPSFVFGRDGGVLPTFLRLVRYSPVTPVVGPGTQRIQPIWVDDVAAYFASRSTSWAPRAARSRLEAPTSSRGTSSTRGSRRCSASGASSCTCPSASCASRQR